MRSPITSLLGLALVIGAGAYVYETMIKDNPTVTSVFDKVSEVADAVGDAADSVKKAGAEGKEFCQFLATSVPKNDALSGSANLRDANPAKVVDATRSYLASAHGMMDKVSPGPVKVAASGYVSIVDRIADAVDNGDVSRAATLSAEKLDSTFAAVRTACKAVGVTVPATP